MLYITCDISPLDGALAASDPCGKDDLVVADVGLLLVRGDEVLGARRVVGEHEGVGVEAGLGGVDGAVVDGAELELEVAPVVGVQLDLDVDRLRWGVR